MPQSIDASKRLTNNLTFLTVIYFGKLKASFVSNVLSTYSLEALHGINDALLQCPPFQAKDLNRLAVVILIDASLGIVATWSLRGRQLIVVFGEVLSDDLRNLLVAEVPCCDEEPLSICCRQLHSLDVRQSKISDINPDECSRVWDLVFTLSSYQVADSLVRGVQSI